MKKTTADRLPSTLDFLDKLNFTIRKSISQKRNVPKSCVNWFDLSTASLISTMQDLMAKNNQTEFEMSIWELAEHAHVSFQSARTRIDRMEQFGLIERKSEWVGQNRKSKSRWAIHQHLSHAVSKSARVSIQAEAAKYFAAVGLKQLTDGVGLDADEQSSFDNLAKKIETERAAKLRETTTWRELDKRFVSGAARVWQYLQSTRGFGSQLPNWHGEPKDLAPAARRERNELTKIFQQYGGRVTAMAWWVFVGGQPIIDPKTNRPAFDINNPHVQFASMDKKPSQFTKHFNAVLSDYTFREMATTKWAVSRPILLEWFGDVIDVSPRNGAEDSDLIGFYVGGNGDPIGGIDA